MADREILVKINVKGGASIGKATKEAKGLADELERSQGIAEGTGKSAGKIGSYASKASSGVRQLSGSFGDLAGRLMVMQMATNAFDQLISQVKQAAGYMLKFSSASEQTQLGIATMVNAMEGGSFNKALEGASETMAEINSMAAETPATGLELAKIYQGVLGPLKGAGLAQREILEAVKNTSVAGAAMGVDMDQAQRDVSLMASGMAGADTKMYQLMKTSGILAKTAKQLGVKLGDDLTKGFNKLDPQKRGQMIKAMLGQFGAAGTAAGQTFSGLYSTIKGNLDNILKAGAGPLFESLKAGMSSISTFIVNNITMITNRAILIGEAFMIAFEPVRSLLAELFGAAGEGVQGMNGQAFADNLRSAAKSVAEILGGIIDRLRPVVGTLMRAASIMGAPAVGAAAGGAVAGAAGAGAAGASMPLFGMFEPIISALSGLGAGPLAAAGAAVVSFGMALANNLEPVIQSVKAAFAFLGPPINAVLASLWGILKPVMTLVGTAGLGLLMVQIGPIIAGVWAFLQVLRPVLYVVQRVAESLKRVLLPPIEIVILLVSKLASKVAEWAEYLNPAIEAMQRFGRTVLDVVLYPINLLGDALVVLAGKTRQALREAKDEDYSSPAPKAREVFVAGVMDATSPRQQVQKLAKSQTKVSINNPRVTIKQDFKGKTDPDRIVRLMMTDLERQAESRMSSVFSGALTR